MKRVARFEKVSRARFEADWHKVFGREAGAVYDAISLPVRATAGSAGYDFKAPCDITLPPGTSVCIPTGIRVWIEEGWTLMLYPRSGLGVRYRLQLNNTVGIIDSDYYAAENEGHIRITRTNNSNEGKTLGLTQGDGFAQGVFTEFGITVEDAASAKRSGGFGSTDQKK